MRKNWYVSMFVLLVAALVLSACGTPATTAPADTATPVVEVQTQVVNVVVTATPGPATATPLPAGSIQVTAAGATFPLPLYTQWTYAYQFVDPSVAINYNGVGSGAGKAAIVAGTVDFAGSDSLLADADYTKGVDLQMYPMVAGAVVPVYNIAFNPVATPTPAAGAAAFALPKLILDRQTLVDIYNAKVTMWNDPKIVALNPGLKDYLPAKTITTVHRSDASGTTEVFTRALTAFSPDWKAGGAQSVQWPGSGLGGKGNAGVAADVLTTPNSIGYVELAYAISNSMSYAQMINKAGKTVTANGASVNSAMADFASTFTDKLTNNIQDGAGVGTWPISGYTYIILHTTSMKDCVKAQKIMDFLKWAQTDPTAQKAATTLGYSVLPDAVRTAVLAKLAMVTCNGQPLK